MSLTLIDSVILIDITSADPEWSQWSADRLQKALDSGGIAVNQIIYAELSAGFASADDLAYVLSRLAVERIPLPFEAAFLAGKAFVEYRRRGGSRRSPLPDFYIGAHAFAAGLTLLTRDDARYRTYLPGTKLIAPTANSDVH